MINLSAFFNQLAPELSQIIENYPDRCSISRPTSPVDEYGDSSASYSTIASGIACAWAPAGRLSKEQLKQAKITAVAPYTVDLPAAINGTALDVQAKDRIVIAAREANPQITFEVQGLPLNNAGLSLFVLCTREE